jgi:hypothetical protein
MLGLSGIDERTASYWTLGIIASNAVVYFFLGLIVALARITFVWLSHRRQSR